MSFLFSIPSIADRLFFSLFSTLSGHALSHPFILSSQITHVKEATDALLRWASGDARSFISWGFRFGGGGDDVDGGAIGFDSFLLRVPPPPCADFFAGSGACVCTASFTRSRALTKRKKERLVECGSFFKFCFVSQKSGPSKKTLFFFDFFFEREKKQLKKKRQAKKVYY